MELDLRLKMKEFIGQDTVEETPELSESEREELKDSILATLRASSFFINWGQGERVFMVGVAWSKYHD